MLIDKEWLMNNIEPMAEVLQKWENTFSLRSNFLKTSENSLQEIFIEWPIYKQSFGHNLVSFIF